MQQTTVGQLMINRALPPALRNYHRQLGGKGVSALFEQVGREYPQQYSRIIKALGDIGRDVAYSTGGFSFGLKHIREAKAAKPIKRQLEMQLQQILTSDKTPEEKSQAIVQAVSKVRDKLEQDVLAESEAEGNPLTAQIRSNARGNAGALRALRGADLLYEDHHGQTIPIPVLRSYSAGLRPEEYWASTYGARKGVVNVKTSTADAGYLAKQLTQASHRLVVTALDNDEDELSAFRGLPVDTTDVESEGALLAQPVGGYARNTTLTPKILKDLQTQNISRILIRSPLVGGPAVGGVSARDVGVRERGSLPARGDFVGITAAQAISEPLSQGSLSSKHAGGVSGAQSNAAVSGFDLIDQLIQVPKVFRGGATHATQDGRVTAIRVAPQGGHYVTVGSQDHYVSPDRTISVKRGQEVDAGDVLSDGIPNPAQIVAHKGIGEGRRYFVQALRQAYRDAGLRAHRRNIELVTRGLLDHVRMTDEVGEYAPNDIVSYSALERTWQPRATASPASLRHAVGQYLEKPVLHYSIGTRVRKSMLPTLRDFGVSQLLVNREPPPFQPEMIRGRVNLTHDPDWMTQQLGSNLQKSLLSAVHRGGSSDAAGTSYVPALIAGTTFGQTGLTAQSK